MDLLIPLIILAGLYMAWNIGANDAANSMATSYGSGALTLKQVIAIGVMLEFMGASLFGQRVTYTIAKGIVPIELIDPNLIVVGALASLLSAGFWITIATYYRLPISTSHSIVGAVLGFGIAAVYQGYLSISDIRWDVMVRIVLSWIISPLFGGFLAFVIFTLIKLVLFEKFDVMSVEKVFRFLQIGTACYVAFAHGSNDVANAVGPLAAALGCIGKEAPIWILLLGGLGISIGFATWGYRVIEMVGRRITELTPTRGFSAEFSTATTVLMASYLGMPISTTHTLVGSVIGVGLAGGLASINLNIIKRILASWLLTLPISAALSIALYIMIIELI